MTITIKYEFDNKIYNYDYVLDYKDLEEYLLPPAYKGKVIEDSYRAGIRKALSECGINEDRVSSDEYFIAFIKERYEEIAREQYEQEEY